MRRSIRGNVCGTTDGFATSRVRRPVSKGWLVVLAVLVMGGLVRTLAEVSRSGAAGETYLQLGDLLSDDGQYEEAIAAYQQATLAESPGLRVRASSGLVTSWLRIAEFDRARDEAAVLRKAAPRNAEAIALSGDALWASGLFEEAEQSFRDALALDPNVARGHNGLARVLAARNRLDEASDEAHTALGLSPREPNIYHTVGSVLERQRRFEEAALAYGNYLNLLPYKDRGDRAVWSRAEIRFLRSFGRRVPLQLDDEAATALHKVPFTLVRDKIMVKGRVNGGRPIDFVLDTGAELTVLSTKVAERHGVYPVVYTLSAGVGEVGLRGLQVGRIDELEIGGLKIKNVPTMIKNPPLKNLPTTERESFSPLTLGLSMTIDYQKQELTIGHAPHEPADVEMPLWVNRLATVRGTVNGGPTSFVVDTGGEVISISEATARSLDSLEARRRIPLKVYGASGWDRAAFLLPTGVDLGFDRLLFPNIPVVVLDLNAPSTLLGFKLGGIVGHKFLSQYKVSIDLDHSTLRLWELQLPGRHHRRPLGTNQDTTELVQVSR